MEGRSGQISAVPCHPIAVPLCPFGTVPAAHIPPIRCLVGWERGICKRQHLLSTNLFQVLAFQVERSF